RRRGRGDERQHPHRAPRGGAHVRSGLPRVRSTAHAVAAGRPTRRERGRRGEGRLPARRPGPRGPGGGGGHRRVLPLDGHPPQPPATASGGGGPRREGPGPPPPPAPPTPPPPRPRL